MKKPFEPNLNTPRTDYCREENNKLTSHLRHQMIKDEYHNDAKGDVEWQVEQLSKSFGIYLEFDRANTGTEKDWRYMIRISTPGGGAFNREQWAIIDDLATKHVNNPYGLPSIRLTTRQNVQFHWLDKKGVLDVVKSCAESGLNSINGCGDNTRNVMGCPLSQFSETFNALAWAHKAGSYFQLPLEPFIKIFAIDPNFIRTPETSFQYASNLLNRKFKIAFSTAHKDPETGKLIPDNCVEALTNDMGIAPVIENNRIQGYQIYVGGGQGERNGKPTMAALAQPLAIVSEEDLLPAMDAVVQVHQAWGDRQNRHWARLKYVIKKQGIEWYRDQVSSRLGSPLQKPNPHLDYGRRHLHHGWHKQPSNGLLAYGAFIENGRLEDSSPNGKLKTMVRAIMDTLPVELYITPNQDLLFCNIPVNAQKEFEALLAKHQFGKRLGKTYSTLRKLSGACVGRDTCRLTYTDSEKFEPGLIDELETMGWGDMAESIGITGCERQCFRPATKTIGLVGTGLNRYQFKLFGDESAQHQGRPLMSSGGESIYLRSVPREQVAQVIDILFKFYQANKKGAEGLGAFHRRIGPDAIIAHLKETELTAPLMEKPFPTDCVID